MLQTLTPQFVLLKPQKQHQSVIKFQHQQNHHMQLVPLWLVTNLKKQCYHKYCKHLTDQVPKSRTCMFNTKLCSTTMNHHKTE